MKLHIASDLHLDLLAPHYPGYRVVEPVPESDVLVLAGDIHHAAEAIQAFTDFGKPVLYVPGNHEFYGGDFEVVRQELRRAAAGTNVMLLDDDEAIVDGVRFLGSTLWTDYALMPGVPQWYAMREADKHLGDRACIRRGGEPFAAQDALAEHETSRRWLEERLATPFSGKTVVVTHHGCSRLSTAERFAGNGLNGAFMSDLDHLVTKADLWIHGHIHDTMDYRIDGTRVIANPRGYAWNRKEGLPVAELDWENRAFIPNLVVEV